MEQKIGTISPKVLTWPKFHKEMENNAEKDG